MIYSKYICKAAKHDRSVQYEKRYNGNNKKKETSMHQTNSEFDYCCLSTLLISPQHSRLPLFHVYAANVTSKIRCTL